MPTFRQHQTQNFLFRFRSVPTDPRKDDLVRSVPYSRREIRRQRWQLALLAAKSLGVISLFICVLVFATKAWRESITNSPLFSATNLLFKSNIPPERGGLTLENVLEITCLRPDVNVMKVNLRELEKVLLSLPQVESAAIQRLFPNRIEIEVTERNPIAWITCPEKGIVPRDSAKGLLIDANGHLFSCHSLLNPYNYLPAIKVPGALLSEDAPILTEWRVQQGLTLLAEFDQIVWPLPLRIQEVRIENEYSLEVSLSDGASITFANENVAKQVNRLEQLYQWAKAHDKSLATAKLIAMQNTPVCFVDGPPRLPKTDSLTEPNSNISKASLTKTNKTAQDIRAIVRGN